MTARGSTLVELIVVIALMGVIALVVTLSLRSARPVDGARARMAAAQRQALRSRRSTALAVETDSGPGLVTYMPDGSAVAQSRLQIDRLTGARHARP